MSTTVNILPQVSDPLQVARTIRSGSIGLMRGQTGFYALDNGRAIPAAVAHRDHALQELLGYPHITFNPVAAYSLGTENALKAWVKARREERFTTVCVVHESETVVTWRAW